MIHLYTGNGKGKTTAAIGQAVRAAGREFRVIFAQFMKGNDTGELYVLKELPAVTILRSEKNFGFYSRMSEAEKTELTEIHNGILNQIIRFVEEGGCDLVVLDEITYPVNWGLLDKEKLERLLALAEEGGTGGEPVEMVMTGRDAAGFLRDRADYITEMKALRHPYEKGVTARRGIEY